MKKNFIKSNKNLTTEQGDTVKKVVDFIVDVIVIVTGGETKKNSK